MNKKEFFTVKELADTLGISRVAVFNRIKKKQIKAQMVGHAYIISAEEVQRLTAGELTEREMKFIRETIKDAMKDYRRTFELLKET